MRQKFFFLIILYCSLQQQYKITFILCINQILVSNTFSFISLQTSLLYQLDFFVVWPVWVLSFLLLFILCSIWFRTICFLYFLGCSGCWLPWIRVCFHFGKISIWDMSCIRLSLLYEKHLLASCPLLPPLLSPLRTWYVMFSQAKFQIAINMYHETFLQCVWIKSHSSSLTNEEKQIWSVSLDLL